MLNPGNHILITGSHRSGTTWVGRTIAQLPNIEYIHEPFNVDYPNQRVGLKLNTWFSDYESSEQKDSIRKAFDKLLTVSSLFYVINLCKPADRNLKGLRIFLNCLIQKARLRPRILIKDPIALLSAGWLETTYNLQVICLIRKPLAFVGSLKKAGWDFEFENFRKQNALMKNSFLPFAEPIHNFCNYHGDFIDRASLLWNVLHYRIAEYRKKYPSWLFVRYEDIALNPGQEFEKIFNYLNLTMNTAVRNYIKLQTSEKNTAETQTTDYGPRNARKSLETWKKRLEPEECERIKIITKDIAALFYD